MPEETPQVKMPMVEKTERELRLYYFITKTIEPMPIGQPKLIEGVLTIFSFDLDRAISEASRTMPIGTNIICAGSKTFNELLALVERTEKKEQAPLPPTEVKAMAKEDFKNGLLLAADTMITDIKDQRAIKRIVAKIL